MKAIVCNEYGRADVLHYTVVPDPVPGPNEVRVKVSAAGVNPVDAKIRQGLLLQRLPHQLPIIPGWDAAGVVDMLGPGETTLSIGDRVYSYCRKPVVHDGAYAEYIVLPESQVAPSPTTIDDTAAAAVPLAALTAWQSLFDAGQLKAGERILIHAGAGGVGAFAIQMAKHAGAYVVATASRSNHNYLRELGADMVIDYTATDFRDAVLSAFPGGLDVVYDTVGGEVQTKSADALKRDGRLVSILAFQQEAAINARGIHTRYVFVAPNRDQLVHIARLIDGGYLRVKLAAVLPLEQAAEAHRMIETQHTSGKIVLRIRV
jgi:NADPH2:quinone reductase